MEGSEPMAALAGHGRALLPADLLLAQVVRLLLPVGRVDDVRLREEAWLLELQPQVSSVWEGSRRRTEPF
jgi:hypothetical protein